MYVIDPHRGFRAMEFTINTNNTSAGSTTSTQFKLPLRSSGTYDFVVDWGDGNSDNITTWDQSETTHTYSSAGAYSLTIGGICQGWKFDNTGDRLKILTIDNWGALRFGPSTGGDEFDGCANLTVPAPGPPKTGATSLSNAFDLCDALTSIDVARMDTSSVTSLEYMFSDCAALTSIDISSWDTSSVTSMLRMFRRCTLLTSVDLSGIDTSSVTNFQELFYQCTALTTVTGIGDIDTSAGTNFQAMFRESNVSSLDLSSWNVSSATNLQDIFYDADNVSTFSVANWDTSNVTSMRGCFRSFDGVNIDLSTWDTSSCTTFRDLFTFYLGTSVGDLSGWDTSSVTTMQNLFYFATNMTTTDVDSWDVTAMTDATSAFQGVTLTTTHYSDILVAWEAQAVQNSVSFHGGSSLYNASGATARAALIADHSWTITDGGAA